MYIDMLIGVNKIKYTQLDVFVKESFPDGDSVNLFIDLYSMINLLYNTNSVKKLEMDMSKIKYRLVLNLLNTVAHYRHYFYSRYKVTSKIYIYNSDVIPEYNNNICNGYKSSKFEKRSSSNTLYLTLNEYVNEEINFFKDISAYLQDIYFIDTGDVDIDIIPRYIIKEYSKKNDVNIIITKNIKTFQLVKLEKTFILYPSRNDSVLIDKTKLYTFLLKKNRSSYVPKINININLYPLVLSIAGVKELDVYGVSGFGVVKAFKTIEKLIVNNTIQNHLIFSKKELSKILENTYDDTDKIYNNLKCLDIDINYDITMTKINKIKIMNQIVDMYDVKAIENINKEYFNNELMLKELSEGCSYTIRKYDRKIRI